MYRGMRTRSALGTRLVSSCRPVAGLHSCVICRFRYEQKTAKSYEQRFARSGIAHKIDLHYFMEIMRNTVEKGDIEREYFPLLSSRWTLTKPTEEVRRNREHIQGGR